MKSYVGESCFSYFAGILNWFNYPIFLRQTVLEYVTYPEKKRNKHKKRENFPTHYMKEDFMKSLL